MAGGKDSITLLMDEVGHLQEYFGPRAQDTIRQAMEKDKLNAQWLSNLEGRCRSERKAELCVLVSQSRLVCEESWSFVIPLRREVQTIAFALLELGEADVRADESALREVVGELRTATRSALAVATHAKQHLQSLVNQMQDTEAEQREVAHGASKEAKELKERSEVLYGEAFNNGALACVGGVAGMATIATTVAATTPPGIVVGVGIGFSAIFGALFATGKACEMGSALEEARIAEGEAESARERQEEAHTIAKTTKELAGLATFHKSMWRGIEVSAEEVAQAFGRVEKIDPMGSRRRAFERCLQDSRAHLLQFVAAIDKYLFFLSTTQYFPMNINIRAIIGSEAYSCMQREAQAALAAPGAA